MPCFMPKAEYRPRPANPEDIGKFIDDVSQFVILSVISFHDDSSNTMLYKITEVLHQSKLLNVSVGVIYLSFTENVNTQIWPFLCF